MNKILIITYYWPPGSGAGVQRWLKFAKYLPYFDIVPIILTVDPAYAAYPFSDPSLEKEIPTDLKVYKTPAFDFFRIFKRNGSSIPAAGFATGADDSLKGKLLRFIRGNFFIPDPRRGWNRSAFNKACQIIANEQVNTIITTSPPHSTQLTGLRLKKRFPGIKWIADLRDPWTDIYYYNEFFQLWPARAIDASYERRVLQSADTIITVGKSLKELFERKVPGIAGKITVIHNGFDPEDFREISSQEPEIFTISYIGTLSDAYPVNGLMEALKTLTEAGHDFRLRFVGPVSPGQAEIIRSSAVPSSVEFIPYVKHAEAVSYMMRSSVLLLIIPDHPENKLIVTGKLFEYLAVRKPVIFIGPVDGEAAHILRSYGHSGIFDGQRPEEIERFILEMMVPGHVDLLPEHTEYTRRALTRKLSGILI